METTEYKKSKNEIVSLIAYLLGVSDRHLEDNFDKQYIDTTFAGNDNAHIVRLLNTIRTNMFLNYWSVSDGMKYEIKNLDKMTLFSEDIKALEAYGVKLIKVNTMPISYLITINKLIEKYIDGVEKAFPRWVEWKYIKQLFLIPNGNKEISQKNELNKFYNYKKLYPYQRYMYWNPKNSGLILISDSKFLKVLYNQNNDYFSHMDLVQEPSEAVRQDIIDFLKEARKIVIVVDCENSDMIKCAAMLKYIEKFPESSKIGEILLVDDENTPPVWQYLHRTTHFLVRRDVVERIKKEKSLVDIHITSEVSRYHYSEKIDSFILVSSDSDFGGLIATIPAKFYVAMELKKSGSAIKENYDDNNISYCYLDDFNIQNVNDFKVSMIKSITNGKLYNLTKINMANIVEEMLKLLQLLPEKIKNKDELIDEIIENVCIENKDGEYFLQLE